MTADERINALLERAGCPVMVVKSDAPPTPERHMAALIDRLEVALENALNERDAAIRDLKRIDLDCDMCAKKDKFEEMGRCDCSECRIADCINTLRDAIYQDAVAHGLWDWAAEYKEMDNLRIECTEFIAEEVLELSEAAKSEREYSEELADVIIMSLSVAGKLGIDIDAAVSRKMSINKGLPWRHEEK